MKAVYFEEFGGPDVLIFGERPKPKPAENEVLIKLSHTSINPVDWKIRKGHIQGLLPHKFPIIPGWDAAGTVEAVGELVTDWKAGDEIFAYARKEFVHGGTYAEYCVLPASSLARKPNNISMAEAAAVPLVALTAWQAMHEQIFPGSKIYISAAAGGVGSFAVQIAKWLGAEVIASASKVNHEYLRSLGADATLDYRHEDIAARIKEFAPQGLDFALDCVGGESLAQTYSLMKAGALLVSIVEPPDANVASSYNVQARFHFVYPSGETLQVIADLLAKNRIKIPTMQENSIRDLVALTTTCETGHTRGKVVLRLDFAH